MKNILWTAGLSLLIVTAYFGGRYLYLKPKNITGDKATEISGKLPDGSLFSLQNLQGYYVLVDFWGSWCMPCRQSHPQLVDLYEELHAQTFVDARGFEIVSVAIEKNEGNWMRTIQEDGLVWPYQLVTKEDFDAPVVKAYHVRQIPTKFLINPEGVIMAVDPSLDEVARLLRGRIGEKK